MKTMEPELFRLTRIPRKKASVGWWLLVALFLTPSFPWMIVSLFVLRSGINSGKWLGTFITQGLAIAGYIWFASMEMPGTGGGFWFLASLLSVALFLSISKIQAIKRQPPPSSLIEPGHPYYPVWAGRKSFGSVGDFSNAHHFSDANKSKGMQGEILTAKMLSEFTTIRGIYAFHGLHWPGTRSADIDHVLLVGNTLILVDSKMWTGAHHIQTAPDQAVTAARGTHSTDKQMLRELKMVPEANALNSYLQSRGHYLNVHPMTVVHSTDGTIPMISNGMRGIERRLYNIDEARAEIRRIVGNRATDHSVVPLDLILDLQSLAGWSIA